MSEKHNIGERLSMGLNNRHLTIRHGNDNLMHFHICRKKSPYSDIFGMTLLEKLKLLLSGFIKLHY